MKKQTLGETFAALRDKSKMSQLAIGEKCGLSEAVVWKLENNRPVRWETVHLILSVGLHVPAGSTRYSEFQILWMKQRQDSAEYHSDDHGKRILSKHAVEACRKFRLLVKDIGPGETKKVLAAATLAAARLKP